MQRQGVSSLAPISPVTYTHRSDVHTPTDASRNSPSQSGAVAVEAHPVSRSHILLYTVRSHICPDTRERVLTTALPVQLISQFVDQVFLLFSPHLPVRGEGRGGDILLLKAGFKVVMSACLVVITITHAVNCRAYGLIRGSGSGRFDRNMLYSL